MGRGRWRLWLDFLLQPDFLAIVVFFCFTLLLYNIKLLRTQLCRQNREKKYTAKAMRTMRLVGTSKHTRQPLSIYTVFWEGAGSRPYRCDVIYTETDLCIHKLRKRRMSKKGKNQVFLFPGSETVVLFHDNMYIQFIEGPYVGSSHGPKLTWWPVTKSH